jgi:hypothetical protein
MNALLTRLFWTRTKATRRSRTARAVRPEIQPLEGRQLLSTFARDITGGTANDMTVYRPSNGTWYTLTASSGFTNNVWNQWGTQGDIPVSNSDFFGNGHADLVVFRPSNGTWYIKDPITGATMTRQWGTAGDVPLGASDFFGHGYDDLAVFRPSNGDWLILDPWTGQVQVSQWGSPGDVPIAHANFDNDGRADIAVYRPSDESWHVLLSGWNYDPSHSFNVQWGVAGDVPIFNSDFDGHGYNDFAVFRPSNGTWYVKDPWTGTTITSQWGTQGDVPLASSNFFGDSLDDFAVYRPSNETWYIKDPATSAVITRQWGLAGDMPLDNADFDGDGRSDIAVFRPSNGTWWVLTSSSNFSSMIERQWGLTGDEAIPGPDAPDPLLTSNVSASYRSFLGDPVFASDGPLPTDVHQQAVGDCQFLSILAGIAARDPNRIRRTIVDMGNGLYSVDLQPYGKDQYVVVDANLPVDSNGNPVYAALGHQNSLWVALLEKAWTFERFESWGASSDPSVGTYSMIWGGGQHEILGVMGYSYNSYSNSSDPYASASFIDQIESDVDAGKLVGVCTNGTVTSGSSLVGEHCYYVKQVNYLQQGDVYIPTSFTMYNPWGYYVTVTIADAQSNLSGELATWA